MAARTATKRKVTAPARARGGLPDFLEPQLATLVDTAPEGEEWIHELKFDGYRILARIERGKATLLSRRGKDWTAHFPAIREAIEALGVKRGFLDGEIAVVVDDGRTSFQALQNAFGGGTPPNLVYFAFDVLHLEERDLTGEPLEARKAELKRLLGRTGVRGRVRLSDHVTGQGREFFETACKRGLEGIVSKRRDLPYRGGRSTEWVKTKCTSRQEFVIGGFTDPEGQRVGIGALLVGHYEDGALVYAGKVGTGFTQKVALQLRGALEEIEAEACPFTVAPPRGWLGANAHWAKPTLVAEVEFTEWTEDGRLRHPAFLGLRADKRPGEVVRERPKGSPTSAPAAEAQSQVQAQPGDGPVTHAKAVARPVRAKKKKAAGAEEPAAAAKPGNSAKPAAAAKPAATAKPTSRSAKPSQPAKPGDLLVLGQRVSHPDRVLWADVGVTKADLARYYEEIGPTMLPYVLGRPLTLVRCPEGTESCFYMKHANVWAPPALKKIPLREARKQGEYLVIVGVESLVALAQMSILEIHTWNSVDEDVDRPNRVVFDLDPGPDVPWKEVCAAARLVRDTLAALGLESFLKTTGGKGLHVVVPLVPGYDIKTCFAFTKAVAEMLERHDPGKYTTAVAKQGREAKILVDYLRNNRGATSVAEFSTRARTGAPVAAPVAWDELGARLRPDGFTLKTIGKRLRALGADPWARYEKVKQAIDAGMLKKVGVKAP